MERLEAAELLGVKTTASARQVRSAFRKRVRADHPDRNSESETDFQRLVEARDVLLTPAPEPEPTPEPLPPRPTPPKPTLTYGYEPYEDNGLEEFITRPPAASLGSVPRSGVGVLTRVRRLGWQILVMGALVLLFTQIVVRGLLFAPGTCVGSSPNGVIEVTCTDQSQLRIETKLDEPTSECPPLTDRFRAGSEVWCVVANN